MIRLGGSNGHGDADTHAIRLNEDEREKSRYDGVPSHVDRLQWLVEEAASVAAVPKAAINLLNGTSQRTLASVGIDITVLARDNALCSVIADDKRAVHVADMSQDPRWTRHPFVDGRWGRTRFLGAYPLICSGGVVFGFMCVMDLRPRVLEPAQCAALNALVPRVIGALEIERSRITKDEAPAGDGL